MDTFEVYQVFIRNGLPYFLNYNAYQKILLCQKHGKEMVDLIINELKHFG